MQQKFLIPPVPSLFLLPVSVISLVVGFVLAKEGAVSRLKLTLKNTFSFHMNQYTSLFFRGLSWLKEDRTMSVGSKARVTFPSCFPAVCPWACTMPAVISPRFRTWLLLLLNFIKLLTTQFSKVSRSLWMTAHPSGAAISLSNFI